MTVKTDDARKPKECQWCEEQFLVYPYRYDSAKYCSNECKGKANGENRERKGEYKNCEWCSEKFYVKPSKDHRRFCSQSCYGKYASQEGLNSGSNNGRWKETKGRYVECSNCGDEKTVMPYELERKDRFFCDHDCYTQWKKENIPTGEDSWNSKEKVEKECKYCNKSFKVVPSLSSKKFCGESCYFKWTKESDYNEGKNNYFWKGDTVRKYGNEWNSKRTDVLVRDDNNCQQCGRSKNLEVHHIIPLRLYKNEEDEINHEYANHIDNLITLCRNCHRMVHFS